MEILITSQSVIKYKAVLESFKALNLSISMITLVNVDSKKCNNPEQPVNSGEQCALNRLYGLNCDISKYDYIISIENWIHIDKDVCEDMCTVLIYSPKKSECSIVNSYPINVNIKYYNAAKNKSEEDLYKSEYGLKYTIGQMIHDEFPNIPSDNWMSDPQFGGIDRVDQIKDTIIKIFKKHDISYVSKVF